MTDAHLDDEAISAVLDGEATPEEAAHADACASCSVRLTELRDASLLVGAPVPPPDPGRRDAAVAAALGALPATVTPIRRRVPPAWLGVAAAMVIAVTALVLVNRNGDDAQEKQAASGAAIAAATTTAPSQELHADAAAPFATTTAASPVNGGDLGDVSTIDLEQAVRDAVGREAATDQSTAASGSSSGGATSSGPASPSCVDELGRPGALVYFATGTLEGTAVTVLAYDDGDTRTLLVVAIEGCVIRDQRETAQP